MTDSLTQRSLALELRYVIDMAVRSKTNKSYWVRRAEDVAAENPQGMRSQHVLHNLGEERIEWLREEQIMERPNHDFVPDPKGPLCSTCKRPLEDPVHGSVATVRGTATPRKTG